ncbi:FAD-dependent oxidoreductase [Leptolyngbya sp. 15MV]|nr:FAD-dependent oxidoreductase [Leptolyngbya sp. 15MV]
MSRSLIATLAHRFGPRTTAAERRLFIKATLAASAGLLLSTRPASAIARLGRDSKKRVVVVGAGFAGLAAGHELKAVGYDVTLIDPRRRVGGRVLSFNATFNNTFIDGRNVEGGAELIGSNHPTWMNYKELFGLEMLDVTEDEGDVIYPIVIDGKPLPDEQGGELWGAMEEALNLMNDLAKDVPEDEPWKADNAQKLDGTSTAEWINGLDVPELVKKLMLINQFSDNGQAAEKQSLLGQLTAVKGGGLEKFWKETEVYRCKGGNGLLAKHLAEKIGMDRIILGLAARSITLRNSTVIVEATDGRTIECDDVVFTAPPPTWDRCEISPALPRAMTPQVGVNTKHLVHTKNRAWRMGEPKRSQYVYSDGLINQTWEGTDAQGFGDDEPACLVGFAGGPPVEKAMAMSREEREQAFADAYEMFFPGVKDAIVATRYMDWPRDEWAKCSYSFPAPGQVTTVGPLMARAHLNGRLHLAGEHTCYKFVGYMEGGLNSGAAVAKRLAQRDGVVR